MTRAATRLPARRIAAATGYVVAMAAVAGAAAWPIYRTPDYLVLTAAAVLGGAATAAAARLLHWRGWLTAVVTAAVFLVLGVLLAVPTLRMDPRQAVPAVVAGAITGFKDLVTVELPVGTYRNLMVPVLLVLLVGTVVALLAAWRPLRGAVLAVPTCLAMVFFGLAFGRPVTSASLTLGPVVVPAPAELATGAAALVLSVTWLSWLALEERRHALRRAADATGVRLSRLRTAVDVRRRLLAVGMVALAVLVAGVAAPAIALGTRDVLRAGIGPDEQVRRAVSPLSTYRQNFDDPRAREVLFTVSGALPARIRIATLTAYDGVTYRALDASSSALDAAFVRVPSHVPAGPGPVSTARVVIGALDGIWLPTFGSVSQVVFDGPDAARLADGFYYNAASTAAIETARGGLRSGDSYTVTAVTAPVPALASLMAPGAPAGSVAPPASLVAWVKLQDAGTGGAALAELISRLRARGYLSHSLQFDAAAPPSWAASLGDYAFQPSASGHSLARIDALFQALLDRQSAQAAAGPGASLVAAVGDDEQFAVAAALIAGQLGFPARVVVGARLSGADTGVPACIAGVCRAADVTVWTEVQSATGQWVPIDVTPQHTQPLDTEVHAQRDPLNATQVHPRAAQEVAPPDPVQQDSHNDLGPTGAEPVDLSALWAGLRVAGIVGAVLAILVGPFVVVVAAKVLRRRARRGAADPVAQVVGGWEEYVDVAVDHGLPAPRTRTRVEVALLHERPAASRLAAAADRAVFSGAATTTADVAEFWRIVVAEHAELGAGRTLWRRLASAVSLRSFTRSLVPRERPWPRPPARPSERRKHRHGDDARST